MILEHFVYSLANIFAHGLYVRMTNDMALCLGSQKLGTRLAPSPQMNSDHSNGGLGVPATGSCIKKSSRHFCTCTYTASSAAVLYQK